MWASATIPSRNRPPTWQLIRKDYYTHYRSRVSPGFDALAIHRLGTALYAKDTWLRRSSRPLYRLARAFVVTAYGIEHPLETRIGRRLFLPLA